RRAGKAHHHITSARRQAAHLAGRAFHDGRADTDLPIPRNDHASIATHRQNGRSVPTGKTVFGHVIHSFVAAEIWPPRGFRKPRPTTSLQHMSESRRLD